MDDVPSSKVAVGFLGPQPYMATALEELRETYDVHVLTPDGWSEQEMDAVAADCRAKGVEAVAGYAQKDAFHHVLINERLGNAVPRRLAFLHCMNKYLMRTLEADAFWFVAIDPLAQSDDEIIDSIAEWPFMLKNTSLSLGRGIYKIKDEDGLRQVLAAYRADTDLQQLIAAQNRRESRRAPKNTFSLGRTHTSFPGPLKHVNGIAHKPFTQNVVRALRVVQRLTQRLVQLLQFCIQKMHEQP